MVQLISGFLSVTGNVRENNEDRFYADEKKRFFIVADGMGGQCAGEKASALAVSVIPERLAERLDPLIGNDDKIVELIDSAVAEANSDIMALGEIDPALNKMGTTVVFLVRSETHLIIGGVGDSRVYRLHEGAMDQVTTDHSLTQALLDAGTITPEEAENHSYRNMLYRYLGCKEGGAGTNPERIDLIAGDRYVICSDGVCDGLDDEGIKKLALEIDDPQEAAEKIVQAALDGGSKDNVTCIVLHAV
ncbi:protein phosphatase 2C domain-containing protein [Planctomycetaceae bacterium]|jgi:serine/threonine protein phosphatase PrpC|nr:protein phosphatase 2C domain-containing protein [bacterium]MDC0307891.1 protein phosphatase 2C domain-containing protein [Planctomycetaceae bacterium]